RIGRARSVSLSLGLIASKLPVRKTKDTGEPFARRCPCYAILFPRKTRSCGFRPLCLDCLGSEGAEQDRTDEQQCDERCERIQVQGKVHVRPHGLLRWDRL